MKLHIAIIALIAVLCTGCKEENNHHPIVTSHHNVMYIGDQMCWAYSPDGIPLIDQSAPTLLKLSSTCSMEAKIQYATRIPTKGYDTVVIALGANNIPDQDVSTFKNTYQEAIDNILADGSKRIVCILPNTTHKGFDSTEYRQAITEICSEVVDPVEHCIHFEAVDGNMSVDDHKILAEVLDTILF